METERQTPHSDGLGHEGAMEIITMTRLLQSNIFLIFFFYVSLSVLFFVDYCIKCMFSLRFPSSNSRER